MFKFKNIQFNKLKKIFLIAECGINHNGNYKLAKRLIMAAKLAGFDAVKFQTYITEALVHRSTKLAKYQFKTNYKTQFEMLKKYSLKKEEFIKLKKFCDKIKIIFLSTPFDLESAKFLDKTINVPVFKISSADLNNYQILNYVKASKKPIILSTGMSTKKMLKKTISFLNYPKSKIAVLHCVSEYPTDIKNSYLGSLNKLKKNFYHGLSDHTANEYTAAAASVMGIKILEKHITISRNMNGPDHNASLPTNELNSFVKLIRDLEYSSKQIKSRPTKEELRNFSVVNRKIFFKEDMIKGSKINFENVLPLRSNLKNVINNNELLNIIGKKIKKNAKKLSPIKKYLV